jgi:hypothetical protein
MKTTGGRVGNMAAPQVADVRTTPSSEDVALAVEINYQRKESLKKKIETRLISGAFDTFGGVSMEELKTRGWAYPILFLYNAIFFTTLIYLTVSNMLTLLNNPFLSVEWCGPQESYALRQRWLWTVQVQVQLKVQVQVQVRRAAVRRGCARRRRRRRFPSTALRFRQCQCLCQRLHQHRICRRGLWKTTKRT